MHTLMTGNITFRLQMFKITYNKRKANQDFPAGSVVKNPPASAGDMGSIPDAGRSHILWGP